MAEAPDTMFPLIRHLSVRLTPLLARLPFSANQITLASLLLGLGCAWAVMQEGAAMAVTSGVMLVLCYLLDNCDGEIARLKDQCTTLGAFFDTFVDWIVHAAFFAALGLGAAATSGDDLWVWLGGTAAMGSTINYVIRFMYDWRLHRAGAKARDFDCDFTGRAVATPSQRPEGWRQWVVFCFRELCRADFCFIVLGLAFFNALWLLLPLCAVGAQVYWMTQLVRGARDYHV